MVRSLIVNFYGRFALHEHNIQDHKFLMRGLGYSFEGMNFRNTKHFCGLRMFFLLHNEKKSHAFDFCMPKLGNDKVENILYNRFENSVPLKLFWNSIYLYTCNYNYDCLLMSVRITILYYRFARRPGDEARCIMYISMVRIKSKKSI